MSEKDITGKRKKYYAFIANGFTTALESEGNIVWFPTPRIDSPSIFSHIIDDEKGGYFSIKPKGSYVHAQKYLDRSLILVNIFSTDKGNIKIVDFLPLSLTGIIRIFESDVEFDVEIKPVFNYGLINPGIDVVENGIVFKNPQSNEGVELLVQGNYEIEDGYKIHIRPGKGYLYLLHSKDLRYGLFSRKGFVYSQPYDALNKTLNYWRSQILRTRKVSFLEELYNVSLLIILGLTYLPSGGLVAAPTTSLPEIVGGDRNWDYRYVWVRDASYGAEALIKAGLFTKARGVLRFLSSVVDPSSKSFDHPLYTVDGTMPPAEEELTWLKGHKLSKPVRIGNAAYLQVQTDVEGAFMDSLYQYMKATGQKEYVEDIWWIIESIAEWVMKSWETKSTDIWEQRGVLEHFVHSKVMNWVALDRASKMAEELGHNFKEWRNEAQKIKEDVLNNGVTSGHFSRYYGSEDVDASLLTLPIYGFIDAKHKIFKNTFKKILDDLVVEKDLLLRYRSDFMGEVAHPFTLTSTWLARVYIRMGMMEDAKRVLLNLASCSTDLYLIAEHVDASLCDPRGNYPQLFPHAGVVSAITELEELNEYST
ncbi:alpha,alpha-trehalase TreH2 [Sulfuracidifex metallicus]|uniref:alpha,alpha-trehalase TreH2 n=1 Tax=Sulfuracidifex metallicus TaxID=47303 RepID=UPI002274131C|nr:alpha,alpha-trehalase TreH2 [Sulfuracidifex metallicus]MCY0849790.1 alpha,alpha-trehalase TreH2 [Sulfuracidifex metallicus]